MVSPPMFRLLNISGYIKKFKGYQQWQPAPCALMVDAIHGSYFESYEAKELNQLLCLDICQACTASTTLSTSFAFL